MIGDELILSFGIGEPWKDGSGEGDCPGRADLRKWR